MKEKKIEEQENKFLKRKKETEKKTLIKETKQNKTFKKKKWIVRKKTREVNGGKIRIGKNKKVG